MSVRRAIIIALVVGVGAALLRSLVFRGDPFAQTVCNVVVGLAVFTYGVARLFDQTRHLPWQIYLAVVGAGLALTALWTIRLF